MKFGHSALVVMAIRHDFFFTAGEVTEKLGDQRNRGDLFDLGSDDAGESDKDPENNYILPINDAATTPAIRQLSAKLTKRKKGSFSPIPLRSWNEIERKNVIQQIAAGERKLQSQDWIQRGSDINGETAGDNSGVSVSLSSDGSIVAIGAGFNDGSGTDAGHVRVYQYANDAWIQRGADINGEAAGDQFGVAVSLSSDGSMVAVGAPHNDGSGNESGQVRVYHYDNNAWTQHGGNIDGMAGYSSFGFSVSLSSDGSMLAVGAPFNDRSSFFAGHVQVYRFTSDAWTQLGGDLNGEASNDSFGYSVSLSSDGSVVAIGAIHNDNNGADAGKVQVYQYTNNVWTQYGGDIVGEAAFDYFGYSVSLSSDGNILAVGAPYNNRGGVDAGQVRVYKYVNNDWSQLGGDINGDGSDHYGFSVSLSIDGSLLAVGAPLNGGGGFSSGHVQVYQISNAGIWTQLGSIINGEAAGDNSGNSVALSSDGNILAVGALHNDNGGTDAGQVRVFHYEEVISLWPSISPTNKHTTSNPSISPTIAPTTASPSIAPTTASPSISPTRKQPTEEPSKFKTKHTKKPSHPSNPKD